MSINPLFRVLDAVCTSIRVGHATNSSSSHSIVVIPSERGASLVDDPPDDGNFGWSWFTLASKTSKLDYLHAMASLQISRRLRNRAAEYSSWYVSDDHPGPPGGLEGDPEHLAGWIASNLLEHEPVLFSKSAPWGVDHESVFSFPLNPETRSIDRDFARWFRDLVCRDDVLVLGGNDNETNSSGYSGVTLGELWPKPRNDEGMSSSFVYDRGDHWVVYNNEDGLKLRIPKDLGENLITPTDDAIVRSDFPELVDIKVTDRCAMGCTFCYQASTPTGPHGDWDKAYRLVDYLAEMGVLEVAIGGGEPLQWRKFSQFVDLLHRKEITPNVTTRIPQRMPPETLPLLGSVGFSCESLEVLEETVFDLSILDRNDPSEDFPEGEVRTTSCLWAKKFVVHIALGVTPMEEVLRMVRFCKQHYLEVLLLDYKPVGRGESFAPYPYTNWVAQIAPIVSPCYSGARSIRGRPHATPIGMRLGIDTGLAQRFRQDLLTILKVDPRLMVGEEGKFSMYIDMVKWSFAKDSYSSARESFPLPEAPGSTKDARGRPLWKTTAEQCEEVLQQFRQW